MVGFVVGRHVDDCRGAFRVGERERERVVALRILCCFFPNRCLFENESKSLLPYMYLISDQVR